MRALVLTPTITKRDSRALDQYLKDIARFNVLAPEEEVELFQRIRSDDQQAFEEIVNRNLRFVVSVAKKYQHCGIPLIDLINEGNLGLVKAVHRFDHTKGFKFISYAVWWIRQSILAAVNTKSRKIKVPLNIQHTCQKIRQAQATFLQSHMRLPSKSELSDILDLDESRITIALDWMHRCSSLDQTLSDDGDLTLGQILPDESVSRPDHHLVVEESKRQAIRSALDLLKPRQSMILHAYFGIDRDYPVTLTDIAEQLGLSRERTRQIKDHALRRLSRLCRNTV
jgi:RNA polymerase primary sigma factor